MAVATLRSSSVTGFNTPISQRRTVPLNTTHTPPEPDRLEPFDPPKKRPTGPVIAPNDAPPPEEASKQTHPGQTTSARFGARNSRYSSQAKFTKKWIQRIGTGLGLPAALISLSGPVLGAKPPIGQRNIPSALQTGKRSQVIAADFGLGYDPEEAAQVLSRTRVTIPNGAVSQSLSRQQVQDALTAACYDSGSAYLRGRDAFNGGASRWAASKVLGEWFNSPNGLVSLRNCLNTVASLFQTGKVTPSELYKNSAFQYTGGGLRTLKFLSDGGFQFRPKTEETANRFIKFINTLP